MRPKVTFAILFSAGVAVTVVLLINGPTHAPPHSGETIAPDASVPSLAAPSPNLENVAVTTTVVPPPPPATPMPLNIETAEECQSRVEAEVEQLLDWSMNKDSASLSNILVRLISKDQEIRAAATEAARQFGSTSAIPALKTAAAATDDLREKIEYLEAAEFLTLPALPFANPPAGLQEEMEVRALARQKELIGETAPNPPVEMPASNHQP